MLAGGLCSDSLGNIMQVPCLYHTHTHTHTNRQRERERERERERDPSTLHPTPYTLHPAPHAETESCTHNQALCLSEQELALFGEQGCAVNIGGPYCIENTKKKKEGEQLEIKI